MPSHKATEYDLLRSALVTDTLLFTRYFFRVQYLRRFEVGQHHRIIAEALNNLLRGNTNRLIINVPPRYGKTEQAVKNFIACGLALNPAARFIHLSYSATLAEDNSVAVKDILQTDEYKRLFPATRIKDGSDTKAKWATTAGGGVYATSTLGQITGFGAGIVEDKERGEQQPFGGAIIIDDPIKPEDAFSDVQRAAVNRRFETTIRSRVNSRTTPIVIIMQRLHAEDLCGYLQKTEGGQWQTICLPALREDGTPLWTFKHTAEELQTLQDVNPYVFQTQYMQNPTPLEGLLYNKSAWKVYDTLPITARAVRKNYTDTADTGADSLVSVDYVETEQGNYILDILCTTAPMEQTETEVAKMLTRDNVEVATIESNNGGRGFARNVERLLRLQGNDITRVEWFHQSANKQARILTESARLQNLTYMPRGWRTLFPRAAAELDGFMKAGRNAHDDVADALTGTIEMRSELHILTYEKEPPAKESEQTTAVAVSDDTVVYVLCRVWEGRAYIIDAAKGLPDETAAKQIKQGRTLFFGAAQDRPIYHQLQDIFGDVYAVRQPASLVGFVQQWESTRARFLFAQHLTPLALESVQYVQPPAVNTSALCFSFLASAIVASLR